jgi:hypothetical protein
VWGALLRVVLLVALGSVVVAYALLGRIILGDSEQHYWPLRQRTQMKHTGWQIFAACVLIVMYALYAELTSPHLAATFAYVVVAHVSVVWTMYVNNWVRKDRPGNMGALGGMLLVLWSYPMTKLGAVEASWMAAVFVVVGFTCMVIGLRRYDYEG